MLLSRGLEHPEWLFSLIALKCCFRLPGVHLKLCKVFICLGTWVWFLKFGHCQFHKNLRSNCLCKNYSWPFFRFPKTFFINPKTTGIKFFIACNAGIFWQASKGIWIKQAQSWIQNWKRLRERQKSVLVPKPTRWQMYLIMCKYRCLVTTQKTPAL